MQPYVDEAQADLDQQSRQHQQDTACQPAIAALLPQPQQQQAQIEQDNQGPEPVGNMDSHPAVGGQLPAQIVGADLLGKIKPMPEVHALRPPLALAGWQIGTGHGGIVGGSPGTQGDLQYHQQQAAV